MTNDQLDAITDVFNDLFGLLRDADPRDKAELHSRIGLRMTYRPGPETVIAEVVTPANARVFGVCPEIDTNRYPTVPQSIYDPATAIAIQERRRRDFTRAAFLCGVSVRRLKGASSRFHMAVGGDPPRREPIFDGGVSPDVGSHLTAPLRNQWIATYKPPTAEGMDVTGERSDGASQLSALPTC